METASVDDWTEQKCLKLIREYRRKPILWDQKNRYYFRRDMKMIAWEEIGKAMKVSADKCKHKMMIVLMSSFRREKARLVKSLKNLSGDNRKDSFRLYRSAWFAFEDMAFLLDKDSERKRQENEDSDETDENGEDTSTRDRDLSLLRQGLKQSYRPAKKPRVKSDNNATEVREPDILQPQTEAGPSQTPSERDEEIVSFITFIGNKMKKYSDTTKNAVQQAICDIIFKADQNAYESNYYNKLAIIDAVEDPLSEDTFEEYVEQKPIIQINYSDSD
ncbi:unnamed protein product [Arctia plantaginis]|uniref:MADF domain-containing protein n=1 Tax=Arctia plantaginis TaxID=874455 RepID=A0A8S0ZNV9_ARCPL|nr:unnamed protein product [Arctia plantaginis]